MRIGKPLEHLQAALRATQAPSLHQHPAELITTIGRQLGYAGFLTYDTLVWVSFFIFRLEKTVVELIYIIPMIAGTLGQLGEIHQFYSRTRETSE
jgi:hypothetical protein